MRRAFASLQFALVSAVQNFTRNLWLSVASVVTMALILVVVGAVLTVTHWAGSLVDQQARGASKLRIYLQDSVSEASIANYQMHIAKDPRIATVTFTSKDMALAQAHAQGLDTIDSAISVLGSNPLPASIDVTTKNLSDLPQINSLARTSPLLDTGSNKKYSTDYNSDVTPKLISFRNWVTVGGLVLSAMFGFISLVIIMVTIRTAVFVRRTEIEIMKLVGATDWFVRWPFILEGILSGIVAAMVSALLISGLYRVMTGALKTTIIAVPYEAGFLALLIVLITLGGAALGGFGSYLGVRRFLSV